MKSLYYHATPYRNLYSIMQNGIKPSADGFVKLCHCKEDAVIFGVDKGLDDDGEHFVVFAVMLDMDDVESYQEQSLLSVVPIHCFRYKGKILPEYIASYLSDLHFYNYSASM